MVHWINIFQSLPFLNIFPKALFYHFYEPFPYCWATSGYFCLYFSLKGQMKMIQRAHGDDEAELITVCGPETSCSCFGNTIGKTATIFYHNQFVILCYM